MAESEGDVTTKKAITETEGDMTTKKEICSCYAQVTTEISFTVATAILSPSS